MFILCFSDQLVIRFSISKKIEEEKLNNLPYCFDGLGRVGG